VDWCLAMVAPLRVTCLWLVMTAVSADAGALSMEGRCVSAGGEWTTYGCHFPIPLDENGVIYSTSDEVYSTMAQCMTARLCPRFGMWGSSNSFLLGRTPDFCPLNCDGGWTYSHETDLSECTSGDAWIATYC